MRRLFVLTGGPCSGKTSIIKYLESKGFTVLHETARKLVEKGILKVEDFKIKEKRDYIQRRIFYAQLSAEEELPKNCLAFLDRGLVDGIAYYWIMDLDPPKEFIEIASKRDYELVFILDQMERYEKDGIRHEDPKEARLIYELIKKAYIELGFKTIRVPVLPLKERTKYILKEIPGLEKELIDLDL